MTVSEPQRIVDALVAAGWQIDYPPGLSWRLVYPGGSRETLLLVPADPESDLYQERMDQLAARLTRLQELGDAAREALNTMHREGVAP